jgi:hypothetical protein
VNECPLVRLWIKHFCRSQSLLSIQSTDNVDLLKCLLRITACRWHIPNSTVSTVISYWLDGQGLIPTKGKILLFSTAGRPALGPTQPPIQWVRAISPGVKQTKYEADHSSSTKVKNGGDTPLSSIYLHGTVFNYLSIVTSIPFFLSLVRS